MLRPLSSQNIESELSYAYLHAVVSKAGASCRIGTRFEDGNGIDATLTLWGPFEGARYRSEVHINIQLKATIDEPIETETHFSYQVRGADHVNDLRDEGVAVPRVLIVLFLPRDADDWLQHSKDSLVLRRCAYWVSLRGAPAPTPSGATVYLPKRQMFSPIALREMAQSIAQEQIPRYEEPPSR